MAHISDVRLAEFHVDVLTRKVPQVSRKVPVIEITFRYAGQPLGEAQLPKADDDEHSNPPASIDDGFESLEPKDDGFDCPEENCFDSPEPEDDKIAEEAPTAFTSKDPAEFPLAKAFSETPESGFEVRLRFKKPLANRGFSSWYWAAACGLLAGLDSYKLLGNKDLKKERQAWGLAKWIQEYGTYQARVHSLGKGANRC